MNWNRTNAGLSNKFTIYHLTIRSSSLNKLSFRIELKKKREMNPLCDHTDNYIFINKSTRLSLILLIFPNYLIFNI